MKLEKKGLSTKKKVILAYFLFWFFIYIFCEKFCELTGISNVDLTRAFLNGFMASLILFATLKERYTRMFAEENYDEFVSSDNLLASFSMAFVPFAGAMTDLNRASGGLTATTFCLSVILILCTCEYTVFLCLTNKERSKLIWNPNCVAFGISLICFITTRPDVAYSLIDVYDYIKYSF
ncbi:hypothetical protein [Pantoea sp. SGAir0183]